MLFAKRKKEKRRKKKSKHNFFSKEAIIKAFNLFSIASLVIVIIKVWFYGDLKKVVKKVNYFFIFL